MSESIRQAIKRTKNMVNRDYPENGESIHEHLDRADLQVVKIQDGGDRPPIDIPPIDVPPVDEPPVDEPPIDVPPPANGGGEDTWPMEDNVFKAGGKYSYLTDIYLDEFLSDPNTVVWPGPGDKTQRAVWLGGYKSNKTHEWPELLQNKNFLFNNARTTGGDYVPYWGISRSYNVTGELKNVKTLRSGGWTNEKEGHASYNDMYGPVRVSNVHHYQAGGQAEQITFRPGSTFLPAPDGSPRPPINGRDVKTYSQQEAKSPWYRSLVAEQQNHWIEYIDCSAIDCGHIKGRASNPFSFFSPGQNLRLQNYVVRTKVPSFTDSASKPNSQSRGGILMAAAYGNITQKAEILGCTVECTRPDRPEIQIWTSVKDLLIDVPELIRHGTNDLPTIDLFASSAKVIINKPVYDVRVILRNPSDKKLISSVVVPAGGYWVHNK